MSWLDSVDFFHIWKPAFGAGISKHSCAITSSELFLFCSGCTCSLSPIWPRITSLQLWNSLAYLTLHLEESSNTEKGPEPVPHGLGGFCLLMEMGLPCVYRCASSLNEVWHHIHFRIMAVAVLNITYVWACFYNMQQFCCKIVVDGKCEIFKILFLLKVRYLKATCVLKECRR